MFTNAPLILITSLILFAPSLSLPTSSLATRSKCSADSSDKLVAGINKNIDLQKEEQAQLKVVKTMVDAGNVDRDKFNAAQSKFVDIVGAGITQRKANQALSDGTAAKEGLATVAKAQAAELKAVRGLTGDATTDDTTFSTLSDMFTGGIAQNQKNAQAAANGCTDAPSATTTKAPKKTNGSDNGN